MFTKDYIQSLKESPLVDEVLIPLLKAMGYHDVNKYHGGAAEQGKDIVCWKTDDLGLRVNLAIVAKAVPLTARANMGSGAAGEVLTQIQQAFGKPYIDPVTAENKDIHRCWVITNQSISKEAEDSIKSALSTGGLMSRFVTFINGDNLWDLIDRYLPVQAVFQKLNEVTKVLKELDPNYLPLVTLEEDKTKITIVPKNQAGSAEPLEVHTQFMFPNDPEGQAALKTLEDSIRTGAHARIPANYVHSVELPEPFNKLFGNLKSNPIEFELAAAFNPVPLLTRVEIHCANGDDFRLEYVDLRVVQAGTEEITFDNHDQPISFQVVLAVNRVSQQVSISISGKTEEPVTVNLALDQLRLQRCLSDSFSIKVIQLSTDIVLFKMRQDSPITQAPDPKLVDLLFDLTYLQKHIGKPIFLPSRAFTADELRTIGLLQTIIHSKQVDATWDHLTVTLLPEAVRDVLINFANGRHGSLRIEQNETEEIFGTSIELGTVRTTIWNAQLVNEVHIRTELTSADDITPITCRFEPGGQNRSLKEYLSCIPSDIDDIEPD